MDKLITSLTTLDKLNLKIMYKLHRAIITIIAVDSIHEHIQILKYAIKYLKNRDIKWIELELNFDPIIPLNTIYFINKFNNNLVYHIEDFIKFYAKNIVHIIHINHIVNSVPVNTDGWILVKTPKRDQRDKYNMIINDANLLHDVICDL